MQIWLSLSSAERDRRWECSAAGRRELLIIRETECLAVLLARQPVPAAVMTASGAMLVGADCIPRWNFFVILCKRMPSHVPVSYNYASFLLSHPFANIPPRCPYFWSLLLGQFQAKLLWVFSTDKLDMSAFPGTIGRVNLSQQFMWLLLFVWSLNGLSVSFFSIKCSSQNPVSHLVTVWTRMRKSCWRRHHMLLPEPCLSSSLHKHLGRRFSETRASLYRGDHMGPPHVKIRFHMRYCYSVQLKLSLLCRETSSLGCLQPDHSSSLTVV